MDYSPGTNPLPFIIGAYSIAVVLIAGYTIWLFRLQKNLRELMAAAEDEKGKA